jgi:AraC-like DNA-binding protein
MAKGMGSEPSLCNSPRAGSVQRTAPLLGFVLANAQVTTNVCSRQRGELGYRLLRRTVPDYNLLYAREGSFVWVIAGVEQPLVGGGLLIVPPGVPHEAYSQSGRFDLLSLHVELRLPGGRDALDLLGVPRIRRVPAGGWLEGYLLGGLREFDRAEVEGGSMERTMRMLRHWASLVTWQLIQDDAEAGRLSPTKPLDPLAARVLDELGRRLDRPTQLEDLVRITGFSAQHLNRVLRQELGVTPLQYLTRMRLERAAEALREGRLTVRGIAQQVGYEDPYYFSRLFKQRYGRSPSQYREAFLLREPPEVDG